MEEDFVMTELGKAMKEVGMNRAIAADGIAIEVIKLAGGPALLNTILQQ